MFVEFMILLRDLIKITKGKLIQGELDTKIQKISIDTRTLRRGDVFLAIVGENFDGHDFLEEAIKKGTSGLIVSKIPDEIELAGLAVSRGFILKVKDTLKALGDIASFFRKKSKAKIIAVTGSNGKTTVKEMTASILESKFKVLKAPQSYNNQIGVPLTLLNLKPWHKIAILELGANHSGEIGKLAKICQPDIGIITNIGKSHLGYFGSQERIFEAKCELIKNSNLKKLVLNSDDSYLRKIRFKNKITFGIENKADFQAKILKTDQKSTLFEVEKTKIKLSLPGIFNVYNALAAIAISRIFGVSFEKIKKSLENYKTLPLRSEIFKIKKVTIFQDCYNSNPTSIIEALKVLERFSAKKIVVFGDMLELGRFSKKEHQKIGRYLNNSKPYLVICVGDLAKFAFKGIKDKNIKKYWIDEALKATKILKPFLNKDVTILIKGSRKMQLEKITEKLKISCKL